MFFKNKKEERIPVYDDENIKEQPNYKERHKDDINKLTIWQKFWRSGKWAIIVSILVFMIFKLILFNGLVPSESMESTIMTNNFIISNRLAYNFANPSRGDIVVFKTDTMDNYYVKRVIGIGGDTVEFKDNKVYINGCQIIENYTQGVTQVNETQKSKYEVPEGKIFLLGDNRENSYDSRFWEDPFVSIDDIYGKVFAEYSIGGDDGYFFKIIESDDVKFSKE